MEIRKNLLPESLKSWKFPYKMTPEFIVVHNTANDASADNEVKYMHKSKEQGGKQVSYHYAVDDKEVVQALEENVNGWHAGDGSKGAGNRKGIAIEICYSKSGGERFTKAEENAVELIVNILNRYGWGIDKVKKHQDFAKKYCPHRTLDLGWQRFLDMVSAKLGTKSEVKPQPPKEEPKPKQKDGFMHERGYYCFGDKGPEVHAMCKFFATNYWGYFGNSRETAKYKLLGSNGKGDLFGPNLKAWVTDFQRRLGLEKDGCVGLITLGEMRKLGFKY